MIVTIITITAIIIIIIIITTIITIITICHHQSSLHYHHHHHQHHHHHCHHQRPDAVAFLDGVVGWSCRCYLFRAVHVVLCPNDMELGKSTESGVTRCVIHVRSNVCLFKGSIIQGSSLCWPWKTMHAERQPVGTPQKLQTRLRNQSHEEKFYNYMIKDNISTRLYFTKHLEAPLQWLQSLSVAFEVLESAAYHGLAAEVAQKATRPATCWKFENRWSVCCKLVITSKKGCIWRYGVPHFWISAFNLQNKERNHWILTAVRWAVSMTTCGSPWSSWEPRSRRMTTFQQWFSVVKTMP